MTVRQIIQNLYEVWLGGEPLAVDSYIDLISVGALIDELFDLFDEGYSPSQIHPVWEV